MPSSVPTPLAAAFGLVPTVLGGVRRLPGKAVQLPILALSTALTSVDAARREYDDLAQRGERLIAKLRGTSFDELEDEVEDRLQGTPLARPYDAVEDALEDLTERVGTTLKRGTRTAGKRLDDAADALEGRRGRGPRQDRRRRGGRRRRRRQRRRGRQRGRPAREEGSGGEEGGQTAAQRVEEAAQRVEQAAEAVEERGGDAGDAVKAAAAAAATAEAVQNDVPADERPKSTPHACGHPARQHPPRHRRERRRRAHRGGRGLRHRRREGAGARRAAAARLRPHDAGARCAVACAA
jgi:hypothetical protein